MIDIILDFIPYLVLLSVIIQVFIIIFRNKIIGNILKFIPSVILGVIGISLFLESKGTFGLSSLGFFYTSILAGFFTVISFTISILITKKNKQN